MTDERTRILDTLAAFIAQRPGLEPRNYISHGRDDEGRRAYRAEVRSIGRDLNQARMLLAAVRWRDSIDAEALKAAFSAFSGRLTWDGEALDYTTGQYWPTEYRRAVCAVLAQALWDCWRDGGDGGDAIRRKARGEFGRAIASRWFN